MVERKKEHNDIVRYVCDNLSKRDEDIEIEILTKAPGVFINYVGQTCCNA